MPAGPDRSERLSIPTEIAMSLIPPVAAEADRSRPHQPAAVDRRVVNACGNVSIPRRKATASIGMNDEQPRQHPLGAASTLAKRHGLSAFSPASARCPGKHSPCNCLRRVIDRRRQGKSDERNGPAGPFRSPRCEWRPSSGLIAVSNHRLVARNLTYATHARRRIACHSFTTEGVTSAINLASQGI